ncbi:MAG: hypothetical protein HOV81_31495 [Kofleriaceae bacterium]|nr:hypothetical protein [Kofleriaceae bacterium]
MRIGLWIVLFGLAVSMADASQPRPPDEAKLWDDAVRRAKPAIDACTASANKAGLYGDVIVELLATKKQWKLKSPKSLGSQGAKIAACIRDALARQSLPSGSGVPHRDSFSHHERIGTPKPLLPAVDVLLPIWRKATAGDVTARAQLAKLVPPDYTLTTDACLRTDSSWLWDAERLWFPTVGQWVPRLWEKLIPAAIGYEVWEAFWLRSAELIVKGAHGLCLVPFGATKQAALRKQFDTVGSCWVGGFEDILLHPRWEMPNDKRYVSIEASHTRACALASTGELTCCGQHSDALATPPADIQKFALFGEWSCALDKTGTASCTPGIEKPPTGTFTKLAVTYGKACALDKSGAIVCWGVNYKNATTAPEGAFTDFVMGAFGTCGLRKNGSVECWGPDKQSVVKPRGSYTRLFGGESSVCGLRKDGTLACWSKDARTVDRPRASRFRDVAVAGRQTCAVRDDARVECWSGVISPIELQTPTGAFAQLSARGEMICGVRTDGRAECWGGMWPGTWLADNTYPYAQLVAGVPAPPPPRSVSVGSRVVDETGAPIADAEVIACIDSPACEIVTRQARTSSASIANMRAAAQSPWDGSYTLATTDADGRWSASIALPVSSSSQQLIAVAVAPRRELGYHVAALTDASKFGDFVLRPATSLDLDARCGKRPCAGKLTMKFTADERGLDGKHLARVPPGSFTIDIVQDAGQPTEHRGSLALDVDFTARKLRRKVVLVGVGRGNMIRGTASLVRRGEPEVAGLEVTSTCRGPGGDVYRSTKTDASGAFKLTEVGAPPCFVAVSYAFRSFEYGRDEEQFFGDSIVVKKLPAAGVKLEARER